MIAGLDIGCISGGLDNVNGGVILDYWLHRLELVAFVVDVIDLLGDVGQNYLQILYQISDLADLSAVHFLLFDVGSLLEVGQKDCYLRLRFFSGCDFGSLSFDRYL